jgi:LPS sulfotransferase NodH
VSAPAAPGLRVAESTLGDPAFDQPPLAAGRARRSYVICTTPRSGSWMLCRQLHAAGLGVPSEYFNERHLVPLCQRWGVDPRDTRAYLQALRAHRTTPNGAWGTKLMWTQFAGRRSALKVALFDGALPILLVRDDRVAQAISMLTAWITGVWELDAEPTTPPRTDLAWDPVNVRDLEGAFARDNAKWNEFFASRRVEPLVVHYEAFVADQPGTVVQIAQALGFADGEYMLPEPEPRPSVLPDEIEAKRRDLIERVRRERAAATSR